MGTVPSYRDPLADVYICPVTGHLAWFTRPAFLDELERPAPESRTPLVPRPCPEHPDELLITLAEDDMAALRRVAVTIEDGHRRVFVTEEGQGWMVVIISPDAVAVFWRKPLAADTGSSVSVTIPNAAAIGVVEDYKGVNTSLTTPIQQTAASGAGKLKKLTATSGAAEASSEKRTVGIARDLL